MKKIFFLSLSLLCLSIVPAKSQYTIVHTFNDTAGEFPYGSLTLSGNTLYGMAYQGGANGKGCIFSININGNGYKDLFDFNGINGSNPRGTNLMLLGKVMFGMTFYGGTHDSGCIFSIDTDGSNYKKLFDFNTINGYYPYGSLTLLGNKLFGMTWEGGINNDGVIFSIDTNGGGYKKLMDFNGINGFEPAGSLILTLSGSRLFGVTGGGGIHHYGNIFAIDTSGNGYKDLFDFNDTIGGALSPTCSLILSGKVLYGMVSNGGRGGYGNIFSIDTDGNRYKDLFDFYAYNGKLPDGPNTSLTLAGKKLFGMTPFGGTFADGNVFSIDTDGNGFKYMFEFNGSNGRFPYGYLTLSGNLLYGLTYIGGIDNDGVIFKIDTSTVSPFNSINELSESLGALKLFPNPSNGIFTIQSSVVNDNLSVEIYNVLGEKVYSQFSTFNSQLSINLNTQPNGIYLYRILEENGNLIGEGKLIIQK